MTATSTTTISARVFEKQVDRELSAMAGQEEWGVKESTFLGE